MKQMDAALADKLKAFGATQADCWNCQGTWVVLHKALERIAAKAGIKFEPPTFVRSEPDECVLVVTGHMGDNTEWSIGECKINQNYKVSGKMQAYPYAMAEKRAKDRVILKLIGISGDVYSEEEADEFREEPSKRIARPIYSKLQAEIDNIAETSSNPKDISDWWAANKVEIDQLPGDWFDSLTARADAAYLDLKQKMGNAA